MSSKKDPVVLAIAVSALLLTTLAASAETGGQDASDNRASTPSTRVISAEIAGGRAEIVIKGQEELLPDGRCAPISEVVTLKAQAEVEGLALDTEVSDECQIVVRYFGEPRFQDGVAPEATESTASQIGDNMKNDNESGIVPAAGPYVGNYLHSRYRLHDPVEMIIADFWLHNDRRWNGDNVFVCSPG